jgi:hypothetical protein
MDFRSPHCHYFWTVGAAGSTPANPKLTFAVCRACRSDLESPSRTIPGRSDFVKHSKYFMNEFGGIFGFLLTSGTVLERIGDESASSGISRFVHHQILLGGLHRHL